MKSTLRLAVIVLSALGAVALVAESATQAQTSAPPRRAFDPTGMRRPDGDARNAKSRPPTNDKRRSANAPRSLDSREESQQRANERYTALPMVTQPHPKALDPLDPTDPRAAIFELAELASFEFYREGDTFSITNGVGRGAHILPIDGMEQLQRTLRFDRLLNSPDPEFREIVIQVRALTEDVNRLNRANHDFGYIPGLEESLMLRGKFWEGMAAVSYWNHLERARDQATSVERLPDGRTVERFDASRYEELASQPSNLAGTFQLAADKNRAQAASEIEERRLLGRRTDAIRGVLQERMAALWRDKILPLLTRHSGPPVVTSPIEIGPPGSGSKGAPPPMYGNIRFRSRLDRVLDHVTLTIQLTDNAGQETEWYLHLPRLEPRKNYQMVYPNGARNVVPGAAEKIDATYTLLSAPGSLLRQPINLDSAAPKSPWSAEKREKTAQAIATNREGDEARRAEERDILQLARRIYPAARNPETTRERLLAALGRSWRYEAELASPANQGLATLEIEPFDATSTEVKSTLKLESDGGIESLALMGRLADESDRGCVLAFVPVEGEPHELKLFREGQERMNNLDAKFGGSAEAAKKIAASHEARANLRRDRFLKGGLPLFTTPGDFRANWQPDVLILRKPELQTAIAEFTARRKQFESACDVVFIDEKDRLWLQHMPAAGLRSEIVYVPLRAKGGR